MKNQIPILNPKFLFNIDSLGWVWMNINVFYCIDSGWVIDDRDTKWILRKIGAM